jgi:glycosyltransferase involved in cell wall biosynthesis
VAPLKILQVSRSNVGGGAERVALELHRQYRLVGHEAVLAVGHATSSVSAGVIEMNTPGLSWSAHSSAVSHGWPRLARMARAAATPGVALDVLQGREDFRFPATAGLADITGSPFDVAHLHNLHGGYFDLRELPALSRRFPIVVTPHDMWLATGHCAHSLGCDRWLVACGSCPHLRVYPALLRDGTAGNLRRKRDIYARSSLRFGVPSRWLASILERSAVAPAIEELRVIPNGIDLTVFRPGDRSAARRRLGVADAELVLVFAAQGIRTNDFKDYSTFDGALSLLSGTEGKSITVFALGADTERTATRGRVTIREVGFQPTRVMVEHFRAADLYVHAARAETFPLAILESLACGVPVIASAVGGIPEQITSRTGILVPPEDPGALAVAISLLEDDPERRMRMGIDAAAYAEQEFSVQRQSRAYLEWFTELIANPLPCK